MVVIAVIVRVVDAVRIVRAVADAGIRRREAADMARSELHAEAAGLGPVAHARAPIGAAVAAVARGDVRRVELAREDLDHAADGI